MVKRAIWLCLFLCSIPGMAQDIDSISPRVHPDNTVSFTLHFPDVSSVSVFIEGINRLYTMRKDNKDLWSVTTGPLDEGLYPYKFVVNTIDILDPANPATMPDMMLHRNILEIPSDNGTAHDLAIVPHGTVHEHLYFSTLFGMHLTFLVYTPPGYSSSNTYPSLYLMQDAGENEAAWLDAGNINLILDNAIAHDRAQPMIVVLPLGYVPVYNGVTEDSGIPKNISQFEQNLLTEIIPLVEKQYAVRTTSDSRALAGHSYGGTQAFIIGLRNTGAFGWIGIFGSGITRYTVWNKLIRSYINDATVVEPDLQLLWVACGTNDLLYDENAGFSVLLSEMNVPHVFYETEGDHSWNTWRSYSDAFIQQLFKD